MSNDVSAPSTENGSHVEDESSQGTSDSPGQVTTGETRKYPPMTSQLAGVTAAVALVLWAVRAVVSRRKPPTQQERLAEAASTLGSSAVDLGGRAARRTAAVAEPVVRDAASLTLSAAQDAAGLAADGTRKVAAAAAGSVREVADGVERVQRAWSKLVTRVIVVVFGSAGYVLGARAGRERYDQIVELAKTAQGAVRG